MTFAFLSFPSGAGAKGGCGPPNSNRSLPGCGMHVGRPFESEAAHCVSYFWAGCMLHVIMHIRNRLGNSVAPIRGLSWNIFFRKVQIWHSGGRPLNGAGRSANFVRNKQFEGFTCLICTECHYIRHRRFSSLNSTTLSCTRMKISRPFVLAR